MSANKTIVLISCAGRHEEFPADAALSPGNALMTNSTNEVLKVATEGKAWARMVAKEDALRGKTVSDAYAAADIVPVHVGVPGEVVQMILVAGVSYARGEQLILNNAGQVKKLSAVTSGVTVRQVIGEVWEAIDLSASGAVASLGKVLLY
jgi:hypothetical protein